jgi:hypothetical protein
MVACHGGTRPSLFCGGEKEESASTGGGVAGGFFAQMQRRALACAVQRYPSLPGMMCARLHFFIHRGARQ